MTVRPIRVVGDPVLRTPCDPIRTVTDGTRTLVRDLLDTVDDPARAGVAANQIGIGQRVTVRLSEAVPLTGGLMLELVEVEGRGGEPGGDVVKLLRKEVVEEGGGVGPGDGENGAVRAVDERRLGDALLAEGVAVVPGHPFGVEKRGPLQRGGPRLRK